ncbi:MAG: magnesium chelatase subunit D [Pseudomonadota bacterium]
MTGRTAWQAAMRALSALAVDPVGLGGITVRARVGPVQSAFEEASDALPLPRHRINPTAPDAQLFGGLDVLASLQEGRVVQQPGLIAEPAVLMLTSAERATGRFAARLAQLLDQKNQHCLVLLDEGIEDDEVPPLTLRERIAFSADLTGLSWRDTDQKVPALDVLSLARQRLGQIETTTEHLDSLVAAAAQFGIDSLRAPLFALRCARALAAIDGQDKVDEPQICEAAELVYAARATRLPETTDTSEAQEPPPPQPESGESGSPGETQSMPLEDILVSAVAAQLPEDIFEQQRRQQIARAKAGGSGAGARRFSQRRGRPLASRPGRPNGQSRIDVVATLRSAAPFQGLRKKREDGAKVVIYPSDLRVRRYETHSDRLLIMAVDASGSSAFARMAEAKGAAELLLARGYAARDHVALVAFSGTEAEVLLPATRSLVQAKRRLAALPGGGGTPLASGLIAATKLVEAATHHGLSPSVVVLTDGRGNIALDGTADRAAARKDTETAAKNLRQSYTPTVVIDISSRPGKDSANLAHWLEAHYLPLPRADAAKISQAADAALRT